ncbi:MAG: hypothetical protein ACYCTZ_04050 [Candidatus Dormibacteria bacterium]
MSGELTSAVKRLARWLGEATEVQVWHVLVWSVASALLLVCGVLGLVHR